MNGAGVDLVGAWYELGRSLVPGRAVEASSGWPVLTTREAFELSRSWALVLARLGPAVESIAWRWLDESAALLAESVGPDELLPSSAALWEVGAALLEAVPRNAFEPWREISVRFDDKRQLVVSNVNDPNMLERALREFFAGQGRAKLPIAGSKRFHVAITVGEAQQVIELWNRYADHSKPLDEFRRDPVALWRAFVARAALLMNGKAADAPYPVEGIPELWDEQAKLGGGLSVLKWGQQKRGWRAVVGAVGAMASDLLDGAGDAAASAGGAAKDAASAVGGAAKEAAAAVERGIGGLLKPLAIGLGVVGALGVGALVLKK